MLRGQVADIIIGSVFLFIGLATCSIAAIRGPSGARILVWLGFWSAMYGAVHLSESPAAVAASPRWLQISAPYANTGMTYLLVVAGALSFMELSLGKLRFITQLAACLLCVCGFNQTDALQQSAWGLLTAYPGDCCGGAIIADSRSGDTERTSKNAYSTTESKRLQAM
jgi:hypothetical protein